MRLLLSILLGTQPPPGVAAAAAAGGGGSGSDKKKPLHCRPPFWQWLVRSLSSAISRGMSADGDELDENAGKAFENLVKLMQQPGFQPEPAVM